MGGEEDIAGVNPGAKEGKDQQRREVLRRVRQCEYVFRENSIMHQAATSIA